MLTTEHKLQLKNRLDSLLQELSERSVDNNLIKDENKSLKEKPIGTALQIANEFLCIIDPNAAIEKDIAKIVLNTDDFKNAKYEKWFRNNPRRINKKTALIHYDSSPFFESKFYWLSNNATKSIISASVHLSPNWEDNNETKKATNLKIGIDFFLKPDSSSILIVLSDLGSLRVLELSEHITNTQLDILANIYDVIALGSINSIHEKMWNSFSISSVNNSFYSGIADLFDELIGYLSLTKDPENVKVFAMRLIGRLLFIWFLRKKGFIYEKETNYFNPLSSVNSTIYYDKILKNLFFNTLNTEKNKREFDNTTPYLNGGLFEIHDNDWYFETIQFPDTYFVRLFDHLKRYNFTTDESTPEYQQVAIDPEMLGRVFESLLATQVTETGESARKAKGAFYTPREIVSFMCVESLREYMYNLFENESERKAVNKLLDSSDFDVEQADTNFKRDLIILGGNKFDERVIDYLKKMKILDPACGSGAFPMGMMQLLLKIYDRLGGKKLDTYEYKLEILKNNIFGIDIEPMAVEISRLRAWLSVIVDENDIRKVKPLPNLDFKFVCANSLVPMIQEISMDDIYIEAKLHEIRDKYFKATQHNEKISLQKEYETVIKDSSSSGGLKVRQMKSFDPFKNRRASSFFNKKYMFGVSDGFDIVIGNPPYIGESSHKEYFKPIKDTLFGRRYYLGKMDYFYFFMHLGIELLLEKGILSFITTNYYPTADGAKKLRNILYNETDILKLVNFNEITIFESARGQHDMITILRKTKSHSAETHQIFANQKITLTGQQLIELLRGRSQFSTSITQKREHLYTNRNTGDYYIRFASSNIDVDNIIIKMATIKYKLGSIALVNQGVISGADTFNAQHHKKYPSISAMKGDGIFVYPVGQLESLGAQIELIKPFYKTSDVNRWFAGVKCNLELLYTDGVAMPSSEFLLHLSKYRKILEGRSEFIDGKRDWYNLHRPRNENIFKGAKIVVRSISKYNDFAYNDIPWYANGGSQGGVFFITKKDNIAFNPFYLLAILNSKLIYVWLYIRGKRKGENLALSGKPLEQIPIAIAKKEIQHEITRLVKQIVDNRKITSMNLEEIEDKLNELVYQIYEITAEEVILIESFYKNHKIKENGSD